jgi:hypothetical protein
MRKVIVSLLIWCCLAPTTSSRLFVAPKSVYLFEYQDQTSREVDPQNKIAGLITHNPKSRYVRYKLKATDFRSYFINDVLFDRKTKTLTFYSLEGSNGTTSSWHLRFYGVTGARLQKWLGITIKTSYSRDMDLFLLVEVGCPAKDVRSGKVIRSRDDLPDV